MKWYSHQTYIAHKKAIEHYDKGIGRYYEWVIKIANSFSRDYSAVGALDVNDLIQSGHLGLVQAWQKIDWDRIAESGNPDAELWSYLKKRIKWSIRREIDKHGAFIKIPRREIEEARKNITATDKALVDLFPKFFDAQFPNYITEITPWDQLQLYDFLDDLMIEYLTPEEKTILELFYGLDGVKRMNAQQIAEYQKVTKRSIENKKLRAIKKLKTNEEVINKIKIYQEL